MLLIRVAFTSNNDVSYLFYMFTSLFGNLFIFITEVNKFDVTAPKQRPCLSVLVSCIDILLKAVLLLEWQALTFFSHTVTVQFIDEL